MRVLTWNVNGLATTLQYHPWSETKSYKVLLDALDSDIICFQEVKCQRSKLSREMALVPGYHAYFSFSKVKLGYSGVAVYVKDTAKQPIRTYEGITGVLDAADDDFEYDLSTPAKLLDDEGRCIILDFGFFVLLNIYFPNDSNESRIDFKMDYHHCVQQRIESFLDKGKQVLLVGDINAVHEEIDHCDAKQSMKDHDITDFKDLPHRRWLDNMIDPKGPLIDMTRLYHPDRLKMYTCWNTRLNARPGNFGTRIDYILASKGLKPWFKYSDIQPDILGSDHCPVYADFLPINQAVADQDGATFVSPLLASNFPEFKQNKLSNYFAKPSSNPPSTQLPPITPASTPSTPSLKRVLSSSSSSTSSRLQPSKKLKSTKKPAPENTALLNYFIKKTENTADTDTISNTTTTKQQSPQKQDTQKQEEDVDLNALIEEAQEKQVTAKAWTSIFTAPKIPTCPFHKLPCVERIVSKKGPNSGRAFYVCCKPTGPKDGPRDEYSCDYFQWKQQTNSNTRGKGLYTQPK
ncbi:GRF-type zinc finger transcription factor [Mucor lusitanicus]|uniref:DNA-(apurinic or apyrimidinic site) endonuclease n=1 Tax=Mucor circinelloides f. lusitanicus TaxID=29924 RepID=A0A8H4B670_MUCCL|nr:GRF-type zinc finger transcription factor [Mucor lusitanicus]